MPRLALVETTADALAEAETEADAEGKREEDTPPMDVTARMYNG